MTKTIAIINHKGGVAKTTTAINLSVGLARSGYRVLAVDLDPQAHLTKGLQIDAYGRDADHTIAALFQRGASLSELIMETHDPQLQVLPSSIRLSKAAENFFTVLFREVRLRDALKPLLPGYDYVLLDNPPNLGVLTTNSIVAADCILIPTDLSIWSLDGLGDLLETLQTTRQGSDGYDWRVLLTKLSGHAEERNERAMGYLTPVADRILQTKIHSTEAIQRGQMRAASDAQHFAAVVSDKHWSRGARDYRSLVREVIEVWPH